MGPRSPSSSRSSRPIRAAPLGGSATASATSRAASNPRGRSSSTRAARVAAPSGSALLAGRERSRRWNERDPGQALDANRARLEGRAAARGLLGLLFLPLFLQRLLRDLLAELLGFVLTLHSR